MMSTPKKARPTRAKRADGEGSVYVDKRTGKWTAELPERLGRGRRGGHGSKSEASTALRRWIVDLEGGADMAEGRASVRGLVELWLRTNVAARDCAPATRYRFEHYGSIIVEYLGGMRVRALDAPAIEAMYRDLVKRRGWSRQSLIHLRSTLNQLLRFAIGRKMLPLTEYTLASIAEIPAEAKGTQRKAALTFEQAMTMWDGVESHRLGAMWRTALFTGLRPGELTGLLWSSVDLDSPTPSVTISRTVQLVRGLPELRDGVKTDGSYRSVALLPQLVDVLRAHRAAQNVERLAARQWANHDLVFATTIGTVLNPSNVRRELAKLCADLELPRISSNELRHTAATIMLDKGMTMSQVAKVLGHRNTRMLEKHYAHHRREVIDDHVAAMTQALAAVGR